MSEEQIIYSTKITDCNGNVYKLIGEPGYTPTIDPDTKCWIINGIVSEYRAIGLDGLPGDKGDTGENGKTPKIKVIDGELFVTYDDANWDSIGYVKGPKGDRGPQGIQGP